MEIKKTGTGQKRYELESGVRMDSSQSEPLYAFPFVDEAELFEEVQVSVEIERQRVDRSIVSVGAGKLVLAIYGDFGPVIRRAVLLVDATALLEPLKEKIEKIKGGEVTINRSFSDAVIGRAVSPPDPAAIPTHSVSVQLNPKQEVAYRQVLRSSITRIWGPPGTGKTKTLGCIVHSALEANKRILICSNTNKAVDQLLLKICDELGCHHAVLDEGHVVRVGRIRDELLSKNYAEYITVDGIVTRRSHELEQRKREIEEAIGKIDARIATAKQVLEWFESLRLHDPTRGICRTTLRWHVNGSKKRRRSSTV